MASSSSRRTPSSISGLRTPAKSTPSSLSKCASTPRTLFEALDSHTVLAVVEGRGQARGEIGMATLNTRTSHLTLCQFSDSQMYHRVITKLNIFRPSQIIMPTTCCEGTGTPSQLFLQLREEANNCQIVPVIRKAFSEGNGLQRVKKLVVDKFSSVVQLVTQKYYCLAAAAALLRFVEVSESVIFSPKSMRIEFQGSENTCMIDSKTARHLELLQNNHLPFSQHSLLGILGGCRTAGGSRFLRMSILQPPCDLKLIQERLDCIEELMESRDVLCGLQDILGRLPSDIEHVISALTQIPKMDNNRITEQRVNSVIALKRILELIPVLRSTLEKTAHEYFQNIHDELQNPIFQTMMSEIERVVNDEAQVQKGMVNMRRQRYFSIKPMVNPILDLSRKAYCEIIDDLNKYIANLSSKHNMAFRLGENINRGFYAQLSLPGRGENIPQLPNTFLNIKKTRNTVTFTTEYLLQLDNRCQVVVKEIENMTSIIMSELVCKIREDISSLYGVSELVANLDLIYAFTSYALTTTRCVRPNFSKIATAITNGRHPVLEQVKSTSPVPNNTFLSEDANFSLITGPNMSGKTTYLKQVATLQILAQIGSFVPAEAATFRTSSSIFSRLGTGDNIEDSASSFAVEMTEMNYILNNVTDDALIIIDELGRGTSIEEGTAMSWALAEALLKRKAFTLFATHYLFLTKMEDMYNNVINYTMETQEWRKIPNTDGNETQEDSDNPLDNCKLKYTHVLKRGVTEVENYGLKLASSLSYPPHIVKNALTISKKIVENRKKPKENSNVEKLDRDKALYLLGSQLKLAAQEYEKANIPYEQLKEYLQTLQKEFLTAYPDPANRTDTAASQYRAAPSHTTVENSQESDVVNNSPGESQSSRDSLQTEISTTQNEIRSQVSPIRTSPSTNPTD